jgi:hypothetical protein
MSREDFSFTREPNEALEYMKRVIQRERNKGPTRPFRLAPPENDVGRRWRQAFVGFGELRVPADARLERLARSWLTSPDPKLRLRGVLAIESFNSHVNAALLKRLLNDEMHQDLVDWAAGRASRLYYIRPAVYSTLYRWGVHVPRPVEFEPLAPGPGGKLVPYIGNVRARCHRAAYVLRKGDALTSWSSEEQGALFGPLQWSVTPTGRRYIGPFGQQAVSLHLANLPRHRHAQLEIELFVIGSWDGDGRLGCGPDILEIDVPGLGTAMRSTFFNNTEDGAAGLKLQSFPDAFGFGDHEGCTGASELRTLGFTEPWNGKVYNRDAVYKLKYTFEHSDADLTVTFIGNTVPQPNIRNLTADENWGIGGMTVKVDRG